MPDKTIRQGLRFLMAGAVNTAITYLIYLLFILFLPYQLAYAVSFIGGIVLSYWLNAFFVFKVAFHWQSFLAFPLVYFVQYIFSAGAMWVLIEQFKIAKELAPLIVVILAIPLTFLLSRFILNIRHKPSMG